MVTTRCCLTPGEYVFPFGKPRPQDPTRHVTTLKTAWKTVRKKANVTGRWHDHRHTLITQLAENGAGEETIRQIVGHVSKEVLRDYRSHPRKVGDSGFYAVNSGRGASRDREGFRGRTSIVSIG